MPPEELDLTCRNCGAILDCMDQEGEPITHSSSGICHMCVKKADESSIKSGRGSISQIESALYGELASHVSHDGHVGAHSVVEFSLRIDPSGCNVITLGVVQDSRPYEVPTIASFFNVDVDHISQIGDTQDDLWSNNLPWGIVGFHSVEGGEVWYFRLNTDVLYVTWSSSWPTVRKAGSNANVHAPD